MKRVCSDMTGVVLEIRVSRGEQVEAGQEVALIESMKMHIPVQSQEAGTVTRVAAEVGAFVNEGDVLLELD